MVFVILYITLFPTDTMLAHANKDQRAQSAHVTTYNTLHGLAVVFTAFPKTGEVRNRVYLQ